MKNNDENLYKKINQLKRKVEELKKSFDHIIEFSDKLNELNIEEEKIFWSRLLKVAMRLIKKADYGSVYKYSDGFVKFIDTVGHDIKILQELQIKDEVFQLTDRKNQVTIISNVVSITQQSTDNITYQKLEKASKPIKDSITFDLFFKERAVGGITLDIKKGSLKRFDQDDKSILEYLLNLTEAFYRKDVEKKLKEHQAYFRQLFDKSTEAIVLLDNDKKIIKANRSFERVFGYKEVEVIGKNINDLIRPITRKDEKIEYTKTNSKKQITRETVRKTKQGEKIFVSLHFFPVNLDDDQIGSYVIYNDITKRKKTERKLKRQKAYFQQLFDESTEAIALLNNENKVLKINKSFENLFGYTNKEAAGRDIDDLIVPPEKKEEGTKYSNQVLNNEDVKKETVRMNKNNKRIYVSLHAFPITLNKGRIGLYAIYNDITKRKKEEQEIKYLSFHDQLTGLYNRRYFENEMERLNNSRLLPISIIMTDINGLKKVNDNLGHVKGDEYIKIVAEEIKEVVREEDILARVGGDEFAILLPETDKKEVEKIENRIQESVKKLDSNYEYPIGISTGSAVKDNEVMDLEEIFKKADIKMYEMKNR